MTACVLLTGGCGVGNQAPVTAPTKARPPTRPKQSVKVINMTVGRDRARVAAAVRDLRRIGFWRDLTGHLYALQLSTRRGLNRIPSDEHLADAVYTSLSDEQGSGAMCDIVFFSTAIVHDRRRQEDYFARGALSRPAPTLRHFWASLLAHELAHCLGEKGLGERAATAWERRALAALERS